MATITNFLSSLDLNSLITIFDIQIALATIVIAFLTKGVVSRIIIGIVNKITKNPQKAKESEMYAPIKKMYVCLAIYIAIRIIPKGEYHAALLNNVFEIVIIIFITKLITTLIHGDSKYLKKFLKKSDKDRVNDFACKILRGIVWIISLFIIMNEIGLLENLSGLITGLGVASAIIALAAQELVKNLLSRSFYSYR